MWAKLRTSIISKQDSKKKMKESNQAPNVNDEYLCAVRTKSYADFFLKVQLLVNDTSSKSPSFCHYGFSEILLDPGQDTIESLLQSSPILTNNSHHDLKSLLINYFEISAEASKFCSQLLKNLNQVQADYAFISQIIDNVNNDYSFDYIISELHSCVVLNDPFTNTSKQDFNSIHERHSSVLQRLKSKKKSVVRKIKLIKGFNKASGVCMTAACGLVAAAAMFLALHTLTALLMGPAIFSLPVKPMKKKLFASVGLLKYGFLRKIGEQLDVATKGAYILNRDFDMMSRLVARVQDEIEHNKEMVRFCLERKEDRVFLQVLKEFKKCEFGFRKQVEELEEHVYLCLVTINRARGLVIKEISKYCEDNSVK